MATVVAVVCVMLVAVLTVVVAVVVSNVVRYCRFGCKMLLTIKPLFRCYFSLSLSFYYC